MPILPLIDLLILFGSGSLAFGFVLKAVAISTHYRPAPFGLTSMDFLVVSAIAFGFALTLAARTWVKLNQPRVVAIENEAARARGHRRASELDFGKVRDDDPHREAPPIRAELGHG